MHTCVRPGCFVLFLKLAYNRQKDTYTKVILGKDKI